jgi:beta-galactosidase
VVYDAEGNKAGEQTLHTAGNPAEIKLTADRTSLRADGDDLVYVEVCLVDKDGNELPTATDLMTFEVSGAGSFRGVCNGDATSTEPFTEPQMHLFSGKLVVTLQASDAEGTLKLVVKDKDNKRIPAKTYTIKVEK